MKKLNEIDLEKLSARGFVTITIIIMAIGMILVSCLEMLLM